MLQTKKWSGLMKLFKVLIFICFFSHTVYSMDIIKINKSHSDNDVRNAYPLLLLTLALDKSKDNYGDYKIEFSSVLLKRKRALKELKIGRIINVYTSATRREWQDTIEPIYFPIMKGILGYKKFLINKEDILKFKNIKTLDDLKRLRVGSGSQWSTTKVLNKLGFNVITGDSYEGLFSMLSKKRFDYFPRGINEIYSELNMRTKKYPNMIIEESKILYFPLPSYFFVSPQNKRLKKRIEHGLWKAYYDGSFEKLFNRFYLDFIQQSNIKNKTIFYMKNPSLPYHKVFDDERLWLK